MKILQANLNQFIKSPTNILDITNAHITEVESFNKYIDINNLKVGKVLKVDKHENADTLFVTNVDLGDTKEQIVCGASNVKEGQYVIVATEGAILPGNFEIKKAKLRGVESNGMICSLEELGFDKETIHNKYQNGIFYFDEEKEVGSNPIKHLLLDGYIMELDLTPNRADLLSHLGFARDLASVLETKVKLPTFKINEVNLKNELNVKIESKNTNSYYARYFSDIKVADSPVWLKGFLESMNTKSVNNVVDITNYILYTYGIPMHAFDALKFKTKDIVVKDNTKTKEVKTLDDSIVKITKDEILITNGKDIMALGGIMGLDNSKVTNDTKEIILEVASFDPMTTRNTSKKLNLHSDSSLRFERGIDEEVMMQALMHATYLLEKYANAKTHKGIKEDVVKKFSNKKININTKEIKQLIGSNIKDETIINILNNLNYKITKESKGNLIVKAPSYRKDIFIKEDVIEEVLRIYGMNNIENKSLLNTSSKGLSNNQKRTRTLRNYLANIGLNEVITYSLMNENEIKLYDDLGDSLSVLKPMSSERTTLRQSLVNGLINTYKYNKARKNQNINIFEIGNVYAKDLEQKKLAVLLTSELNYSNLLDTSTNIDFYYLSGILKNIFKLMNIEYKLVQSNKNNLHPYQQASIMVNNKEIGFIAKIHPNTIKEDAFVFEINLNLLSNSKKFNYKPISKYPNVLRDIAFIIDDNISMDELLFKIKQTGTKKLVKVSLFDVYKGENIEKGKMSVAFKLVFNDPLKTLESDEAEKLVNKILKRLKHEYKIIIRD